MLSRQLPTRGPGVDLEDLRDRAQSFREFVLRRIHVDELSMHPFNRGGAGIVPYHVHHVANDCLENRTSLQRYGHVCVKEIPPAQRKVVIDFNAHKARGNPLLPKVHPDRLRYVVLTKTHFVHAQKLAKDGNRTLYDQGKTRINWPDEDREGREILLQGPVCCVHRQGLCTDEAAAKILGRSWGPLGAYPARAHSSLPLIFSSAGQCGSTGLPWRRLCGAGSGPQWAAVGGGRPKRPPRGGPPGGPEETKIIFPLVVERLRVASLTQAFKEVLIKEELKTQLVKMVVTAALNEKKQAAFKKETLLVTDR